MKKIHIFLAVWGDQYVNIALKTLFPSLMQEGNLKAIQEKYDVFIHIYCERSQNEKFSNALKETSQKLIFIDVVDIEQFVQNAHKYGKMTTCHRHFMGQLQVGEYAVFLHPDFFISDNLFVALDSEMFATSCNCYFSHVLRISNENVAELERLLRINNSINSYQLAEFSLMNELPLSKSYDIQSRISSSWPIELTAKKDFVKFVYSYGMHPLAIRKIKEVDFECFDNDLAEKMYGEGCFEGFKVQRDNKKFMITELNKPNMWIGVKIPKKQSPVYCAAIYIQYLPGAIRDFFISEPIIYYANNNFASENSPYKLRVFIFFIRWTKIVLIKTRFVCEKLIKWRIGSVPPYVITE
jgi:hypothetical protein